MKPYLERLPPDPHASLSLLNRRLDDAIPFQWHHHPEYELTLTLNSRGQRFIGDHVGDYNDGDLVLVGPNLPHTWASREKYNQTEPHIALVLWFHPEWIAAVTKLFVEFRSIENLLVRAQRGLQFSKLFSQELRHDIEKAVSSSDSQLSPPERLMAVLKILNRLADDANAQPLASAAVSQHSGGDGEGIGEGRERIDRVLTYIHMNYAHNIGLAKLADIAALSPSGLHRLFRRHTHTNISDYLMRLRIGDACARLSGTAQPIAHIADAVGYVSLANFNRQFKSLKAVNPRQYRALFR